MINLISKDKLRKFEKLSGEIRGTTLKAYGDFILKEEGKEGLERLEKAMSGAGYPINYTKIEEMKFFSIAYQAVTIELIKNMFDYGPKEFQDIGRFSAKFSFIIRLVAKYFFSVEKVVKRVNKIWRKHYTVGDIEIVEADTENKRSIVRIKNFEVHPLQCEVLKGYLSSILQMVVGEERVGKETKCTFRGDDYHEFIFISSP